MRLRIGYVAIALNLPKVTSSSQLTYTRYAKLFEQDKINNLKKVTASNLEDLKKIILYNQNHEIHFYRMTSKLIPLATHPEVKEWQYTKFFEPDFKIIGDLIRSSKMRVDTHPDQFDVINSHREEVFKRTVTDLKYHVKLFEALEIEHPKMVIHVGGSQGGKDVAKQRFIDNFRRMPEQIQNKIILENDDKVYTVEDVLEICKILHIPMVLDIHHHWCKGGQEIKIEDYIVDILKTWEKEWLPPKIHLSSPKEHALDRKHADYINISDFKKLVTVLRPYGKEVDIMLEAKQKDKALFQLIEDIKRSDMKVQWEDATTLIID